MVMLPIWMGRSGAMAGSFRQNCLNFEQPLHAKPLSRKARLR
jgi:hypothetical protein